MPSLITSLDGTTAVVCSRCQGPHNDEFATHRSFLITCSSGTQSTWSESWKSSEFITTKIAFTSRSVAALQENDLANHRPPMPSLITTLDGTIAVVCSRCQGLHNYEFATTLFASAKLRLLLDSLRSKLVYFTAPWRTAKLSPEFTAGASPWPRGASPCSMTGSASGLCPGSLSLERAFGASGLRSRPSARHRPDFGPKPRAKHRIAREHLWVGSSISKCEVNNRTGLPEFRLRACFSRVSRRSMWMAS